MSIVDRVADILEDDILSRYPQVLEILLCDRTTGKNIFWATDTYTHLGESYKFDGQMLPELITGKNGHIIMPRVKKSKILQKNRSREMAEVFTPSWICNAQNNLVDTAWFGSENVFNTEISEGKIHTWKRTKWIIAFPEWKTWKDYIRDTRLEIACGEGPYLVSRYDTTTGVFIPVSERIGMLDRKLRVIEENTKTPGEWLEYARIAYQNTYGYEWQWDSLLLAREALLVTFIENYKKKFKKEPTMPSIQSIANIISWNIWQMDGLKCVIPNSCRDSKREISNLFGDLEIQVTPCEWCMKYNIHRHNGVYCKIMDWEAKKTEGFIDLLEKK